MIPPSFLCHLEQSMQCHLPSLIIMSIGVRPSREAKRAPCDPPLAPHAVSGRVGPGEGSGRRRGLRRARNGGDSAAGENVARGGGKMAASRGEGGEEEGGRLRRKHDGSVQQPLTEKNWPGTKKFQRDDFLLPREGPRPSLRTGSEVGRFTWFLPPALIVALIVAHSKETTIDPRIRPGERDGGQFCEA